MTREKCCHFILLLVFQLLIQCGYGFRPFFHGRRRGGRMGEPSANANLLVIPPRITDLWVPQKLDNFDATNNATWMNRYFANDQYYKPGGPIFLMFSGESPAAKSFMISGAWINYANTFGALCLQLEHRFYGKSYPTNDLSLPSLYYLTSEQFLADAANFIKVMTEKYNLSPNQKWILFGGSYAGALTVWFSELYSHLVGGAVASSGPVYLEVNFKQYLEGISKPIRWYSRKCATAVAEAFADLSNQLTTYDGQQLINKNFQLCNSAVNLTKLDSINLIDSIVGEFMDIVQYNGDNTNYANITVGKLCSVMKDKSLGSPLMRLAKLNSLYMSGYFESCIDYKYKKMIRELRQTPLTSSVADGDRQWFYQDCNEFGYFQPTAAKDQLFGSSITLEYLMRQCTDVFGKEFNSKQITRNVFMGNLYYGGYEPNVRNVLSVEGTMDPWNFLGITKRGQTKGVEVVFIKGTAHVADMYAPISTDLPSMSKARLEVVLFINRILKVASNADVLRNFKHYAYTLYGQSGSSSASSSSSTASQPPPPNVLSPNNTVNMVNAAVKASPSSSTAQSNDNSDSILSNTTSSPINTMSINAISSIIHNNPSQNSPSTSSPPSTPNHNASPTASSTAQSQAAISSTAQSNSYTKPSAESNSPTATSVTALSRMINGQYSNSPPIPSVPPSVSSPSAHMQSLIFSHLIEANAPSISILPNTSQTPTDDSISSKGNATSSIINPNSTYNNPMMMNHDPDVMHKRHHHLPKRHHKKVHLNKVPAKNVVTQKQQKSLAKASTTSSSDSSSSPSSSGSSSGSSSSSTSSRKPQKKLVKK